MVYHLCHDYADHTALPSDCQGFSPLYKQYIFFIFYFVEVISKGTTLQKHFATESTELSFDAGEKVEIYSKSAGVQLDYWGGKVCTCISSICIKNLAILSRTQHWFLPDRVFRQIRSVGATISKF